ncbi:hypothetical protein GQ44DRAFT_764111 [Phaeosphaeriaceae sp. PMI808]|nr:hypothetical protein GQ44DRAFT_764111 [Phaeosphaeriaceae sp. PMI808]
MADTYTSHSNTASSQLRDSRFESKNTYSQCTNESTRSSPGKWWKQWQTVQLFLCCVLGVGVGVGHHFYYSYLDGRAAQNQSWIIRSGTAIAFLAKLLFSISVGVAFPQRVWQTLRSKPLTIGAVDALFALRGEASSFFNREMIAHAKIASIIAISFWSLALVPILVSGSISVKNTVHVQVATGMLVQNLNFSRPLSDVQYNGTTPLFTLPLANTVGIGGAPEQYNNPSSPATSFISNTLYSKRIIDAQSPCGANCSFTQSFVGPAYKCEDVDFTQNTTNGNPFCTKSGFGHGDCGGYFDPIMRSNPFIANWYMARNSSGNVCVGPSGDEYDRCTINAQPWWDGKLWVLYQYLLPQYRNSSSIGTNSIPVPDDAWERHLFVCQSYNATYSVKRTYQNFRQTVHGTLNYLNPVDYNGIKVGLSDKDTIKYPAWVIHQTIYSLINGGIMPNGRLVETDTTGLAMSALVQDLPFPLESYSGYRSSMAQKPVQFLRNAIQELHFNITVGLLSLTPQLLYSQNATVDVETQIAENVWSYDWHILIATYGTAAFLDIIAIIIAVRAMMKNGGCYGVGFARTVATTKNNRALDHVPRVWEHGMDPMPNDVKYTRVSFGGSRGLR